MRKAPRVTSLAVCRLNFGGPTLMLIALIGCSERPRPEGNRGVVVVPVSVPPSRTAVTPAGTNLASTATSSTPPRVVMRKTFTDPPLPPELREDGGLTPLPPRPTAAEMATVMPSRFDAAPTDTGGEDRP